MESFVHDIQLNMSWDLQLWAIHSLLRFTDAQKQACTWRGIALFAIVRFIFPGLDKSAETRAPKTTQMTKMWGELNFWCACFGALVLSLGPKPPRALKSCLNNNWNKCYGIIHTCIFLANLWFYTDLCCVFRPAFGCYTTDLLTWVTSSFYC